MKYERGEFAVRDGDFGTIIVTNRSIITGKRSSMIMSNTSSNAVAEWADRRFKGQANGLVQDVFPKLTAEEREFLISGITPEEWKKHIATSEEDSEDHE
jgi:hypothetical protein